MKLMSLQIKKNKSVVYYKDFPQDKYHLLFLDDTFSMTHSQDFYSLMIDIWVVETLYRINLYIDNHAKHKI